MITGLEKNKNNLLRAAVLGDPVAQSLSPKLHGFWLKHYQIHGEYTAIHTPPASLRDTLFRLRDAGFRGCNITVPHKEQALTWMDAVDASAARIGAVNTVRFVDGRMLGSNSDAPGFIANLTAATGDVTPFLHHAVVIGAGGAARAVVDGLVEAGAERITLINRTLTKAETIAAHYAPCGAVALEDDTEIRKALASAGLLVNTTTLGMQGIEPLALPLEYLPMHALVTDIVYKPLITPLLQQAAARGLRTVDGLGMLIHQAVPGFAAWFGVTPVPDEALRAWLLT